MGALNMSDLAHETGRKPRQLSSSDQAASNEAVAQAEAAHSRYRIRFGKQGPLRYCSHLDLMRVWERVFRRAGTPLVYSQGFNPRPKLQIAAGLPLGYCSTCEVLDIWLVGDLPQPGATLSLLQAVSPPGLAVEAIHPVDLREPALQSLTRLAIYHVILGSGQVDRPVLEERVKAMLAETDIMRERRGKTYKLRPLIKEIEIESDDPLTLRMMLSLSQDKGTGRPDEVLEALGIDPLSAHVTRTAIEF